MKALYTLILCVCVISCTSTKNTTPATTAQLAARQSLLESQLFEFEAQRAYPTASNALQQLGNQQLLGIGNSSGVIQLQGNPNYLRIHKDSVAMYLPYYGERQMGGGFTNRTGIEARSKIINFKEKAETDKETRVLTFSVKDQAELYAVTMTIFPSLQTDIVVTSTQRTAIRYSGNINNLDESDWK